MLKTEVIKMNENNVSQEITQEEKQRLLDLEKDRQNSMIKRSKIGEMIATLMIGISIVMLIIFILFSEIMMGVFCGVILLCSAFICASSLKQRKICEDTKAAADKGWDEYLEYLSKEAEKKK